MQIIWKYKLLVLTKSCDTVSYLFTTETVQNFKIELLHCKIKCRYKFMVSTISADRLRCKNKVNSDEDDAPIQSRLFRESAKKNETHINYNPRYNL